ncbi:hypothetical protein BKA69DRAFT_1029249 [Paraphysoderma sedebokerense]|nr:hypothetical protein BKA69DRAFT_1029249 [Paraphysoderma sedebokerense]
MATDIVSTTEKPLSGEIIGASISLIAPTSTGLSHAFVRLDVSNKEISTIDALAEFPHLRYIDLSNNKIATLIPGLTVQDHLLSLNLSHNKLQEISKEVFLKKAYLQQVNFSANEITGSDLSTWMNLKWVNLNKNKLQELFFLEAPELAHIEARENQLTSTASINAPQLKALYLAKNDITGIQGLHHLEKLERLHLRDNKVEKLDGFGERMKNLTYLNLRNNKITDFKELNKLKCISSLRELALQDNPISGQDDYRLQVIFRIPQLLKLDKELITPEEREEAEDLRVQVEQMEAEAAIAAAAAAAAAKLAESENTAAENSGEVEGGEVRNGDEDTLVRREGEGEGEGDESGEGNDLGGGGDGSTETSDGQNTQE